MTETETPLTENDFDEVDREALNRALRLALARDEREGSDQIKHFLAHDGWWHAASSASYQLQCDNLGLGPHQEPPCHGEPCDPPRQGRGVNADAAKLMKRLISYGLSMYEPDPIFAINNASKKGRSK